MSKVPFHDNDDHNLQGPRLGNVLLNTSVPDDSWEFFNLRSWVPGKGTIEAVGGDLYWILLPDDDASDVSEATEVLDSGSSDPAVAAAGLLKEGQIGFWSCGRGISGDQGPYIAVKGVSGAATGVRVIRQ